MKINKFKESIVNEKLKDLFFKTIPDTNAKNADELFPFKCKFKNRNPDPGICYVTSINFLERSLSCTNGRYSYSPDFDDVEFIPDLFLLNKYNL